MRVISLFDSITIKIKSIIFTKDVVVEKTTCPDLIDLFFGGYFLRTENVVFKSYSSSFSLHGYSTPISLTIAMTAHAIRFGAFGKK